MMGWGFIEQEERFIEFKVDERHEFVVIEDGERRGRAEHIITRVLRVGRTKYKLRLC